MLTWLLEHPRRPFIRFVADNSKSVLAAIMTHFLAGASTLVLSDVVDKKAHVMACDWYFIIFVWDSIIGVSLTLVLHQWSAKKFATMPMLEFLSRIGDYDSKPDPITGFREASSTFQCVNRWGYQVLHWVVCAAVARVLDFGIMYLGASILARIATGVIFVWSFCI